MYVAMATLLGNSVPQNPSVGFDEETNSFEAELEFDKKIFHKISLWPHNDVILVFNELPQHSTRMCLI